MMRCVGNLRWHSVATISAHCADEVFEHGAALLVSADCHGYVWVNSDLDAVMPDEAIGTFPLGDGRLSLARTLREHFEFAMSTRTFVPHRGRGPAKKKTAVLA